MFIMFHDGYMGIQSPWTNLSFKGLGVIDVGEFSDPMHGISDGIWDIPFVPRSSPFEDVFESENPPRYLTGGSAIASAWLRITPEEVALYTANKSDPEHKSWEMDKTIVKVGPTSRIFLPTVLLKENQVAFMTAALAAGGSREKLSELAVKHLIGNKRPITWLLYSDVRKRLMGVKESEGK